MYNDDGLQRICGEIGTAIQVQTWSSDITCFCPCYGICHREGGYGSLIMQVSKHYNLVVKIAHAIQPCDPI